MRGAILAAVAYCGAVAVVSCWWAAFERVAGTNRYVAGLDHALARALLTPPARWLAATLMLWWLQEPSPWLAPLLAGVTLTFVNLLAERLFWLSAAMTGLSESLVALIAAAVAAGWWACATAPGQSWRRRLAGVVVLVSLALVERIFATSLDVAVKHREIVSTGLRPLLVDDPSWELDYVYVSPDRRSISVGYENAAADNSLSVDLLRVDGATAERLPRLGTGETRSSEASSRYLARVDDQVVRLEFDHGGPDDVKAAQILASLRPVAPRELAERDAGLTRAWSHA
ncbi:hypothetical protein [Actinopolymorpha alba]|uniref:hypothetical protein n=1 Tax=Actinopolymorpha alba TaxID=533267 RepID=UPI00037C2E95|nr:hypothetical protein [Actinopolymorpha alba]